jgi:hypothetical protein
LIQGFGWQITSKMEAWQLAKKQAGPVTGLLQKEE